MLFCLSSARPPPRSLDSVLLAAIHQRPVYSLHTHDMATPPSPLHSTCTRFPPTCDAAVSSALSSRAQAICYSTAPHKAHSDANGDTNTTGLCLRQSFAKHTHTRPRNAWSRSEPWIHLALKHLPVDVGTCLLTRWARCTTPSRLHLHPPCHFCPCPKVGARPSAALAHPEQKTVTGPSILRCYATNKSPLPFSCTLTQPPRFLVPFSLLAG